MEEKTRMHAMATSITTIIAAVGIGIICSLTTNTTNGGVIGPTMSCWLIVGCAIPSSFAFGLTRYVRIVPSLIIMVGQIGLLAPLVVLRSPTHAFLAAGLAALILVVLIVEGKALKRPAPTP